MEFILPFLCSEMLSQFFMLLLQLSQKKALLFTNDPSLTTAPQTSAELECKPLQIKSDRNGLRPELFIADSKRQHCIYEIEKLLICQESLYHSRYNGKNTNEEAQ